VPVDCRLDAQSTRVVVAADLKEQALGGAADECVLCISEVGDAVGVGATRAGDIVGFSKFHAPVPLKGAAQVVTKKIQFFIVADIDALGLFLGTQNCAASFPCPLCSIALKDVPLGLAALVAAGKAPPRLRTLEDMHKCSTGYKFAANGLSEKKQKEQAPRFMSVVRPGQGALSN